MSFKHDNYVDFIITILKLKYKIILKSIKNVIYMFENLKNGCYLKEFWKYNYGVEKKERERERAWESDRYSMAAS